MKKIYIILTCTGTALSNIIKIYTRDEFTHASIALDEDLDRMYSFGRLNPYNPFIGGFVHERIDSGTFKRFYKTMAQVYCLEVTDEQYEIVKNTLEKVEREKDEYTFNTLGIFEVAINRKRKKKNCFYCAEFVKYVLDQANIVPGLPEIIKPESFKGIKGKVIYHGLLQKYKRYAVQ